MLKFSTKDLDALMRIRTINLMFKIFVESYINATGYLMPFVEFMQFKSVSYPDVLLYC